MSTTLAGRPGGSSAARAAAFSLKPFEILARTSLILATLAGFGLGLLLMMPVAFRLPVVLPWLPLVQVHGQVQVLGFVTLFIFAVSTVLFPRFLNAPLWSPRLAVAGGLLLAAGVLLRAVAQPLPPSAPRAAALLLSGALELAGPLVFAGTLHRSRRASVQPFALWQLPVGIGFAALLFGLLLNLWAVWRLALDGLSTVPLGLDEAIVYAQVNGFIVSVGLAVSLRIFPQFLILRPPRLAALPWLLVLYGLSVLLTVGGWLALELQPDNRPLAASARAAGGVLGLAALTGFVLALRLYEPAARDSGRPHITNPTRLWFRLAYAWLLGSLLLHTALGLREALGGPFASFTELSAARHALTMGFLVVLVVGMAARILPGYSGWAIRHPRLLWQMIGLLLTGAALRVGGELLGGYGGFFGPITGLGGVIATAGFLTFAASLWPALGHLPSSE